MYNRSNGPWRTLPWLACVAFAVAGCQKAGTTAADAVIAHAAGERIDIAPAGDLIAYDAGDGALAKAGVGLPLPDTFPKDVYLPRQYTVNSVLDMDGTAMVAVTAPGRVTSLFADARSTMRARGWTQTMAAQHSVDNAVLAFEKDRRNATLSFNRVQDSETQSRQGVVVSVQLREQ